jgi:Cdc6-like AAA superfamily ATPase
MDFDFKPKRSSSPNDVSEEDTVLCVRQLLSGTETKTRLSDNDKTANYDGYIELLNSRFICGKITVQIKTYETRYAGARKHPIPTSLLGYALSVPTEVVMLLVIDHAENAVYWKHISQEFIDENKSKSHQETIIYHFAKNEILNRNNRCNIVEQWKGIYASLAESIAQNQNRIQKIIDSYANAFEHVDTCFFNLPNSHIERKELTEIDDWIRKDLKEDDPWFNNVCMVTGEAGAGKSVVIKQLAHRLKGKSTPVLAIKADMRSITSEKVMEEICEVITHLSSDKTKRTVLLIDQIDALSQTLTNDRSQIKAYYSIIKKFGIMDKKD